MTDSPPEPPDIGPEGPIQEDDPPTEPDGAPEKGPSPQWAKDERPPRAGSSEAQGGRPTSYPRGQKVKPAAVR